MALISEKIQKFLLNSQIVDLEKINVELLFVLKISNQIIK
jgi:hypothetical protein